LISSGRRFLNFQPSYNIRRLRGSRLIRYSERSLHSHPAGSGLAPPTNVEDCEAVQPDHVEKILNLLRDMYRWVVVDTSSHLNEVTLVALERANRVYLLCDNMVPTVRACQRMLDTLSRLGIDTEQFRAVMSKPFPRSEITAKDVSEALKCEVVASIPYDDSTSVAAANQGLPLPRGERAQRRRRGDRRVGEEGSRHRGARADVARSVRKTILRSEAVTMGLLDRVRDRQNPTNGETTTAAPKAPNGAPVAAEKTASSAPSGHGHASRPTPHGRARAERPNGGLPKPSFQRRSTADPSAAKVAAPTAQPRGPTPGVRASGRRLRSASRSTRSASSSAI
jgi:hypothetical protein